jgi:nucleotide-binding universal stress UspA family protein
MEEKFVILSSHTYSRAILLKSLLEQAEIPCFLKQVGSPAGAVEIHIRERDILAADKLLTEFGMASGKQKEPFLKTLRSIRRILVPVDFSAMSLQAAHYALELGRTLKADIRLLHVWFSNAGEPLVFNEVYAYQLNFEGILHEQEENARKRMEDFCQSLRQTAKDKAIKGVHIDFDLVRGNAVESILSIANDYNPGLIVMGTHGRSRENRPMLGSTTAKVMEKSRFPVLTIPVDYDVESFRQPQKILYITRFEESDILALHQLIAFVRPFKVKIYCVHVNMNDSMFVDEVNMKRLREHFNREYQEFNIECGLVETSDLLEGIESFIYEKQIDVVSLVSRKRNLISQLLKPSLSRKILFQSEIPMLVFRDRQ